MVRAGTFSPIFLSWIIASTNTLVAADVRLVNVPQGAPGYTQNCIRALGRTVKCDKSLLQVDAANEYYDEYTISSLCTSTCRASLDLYLDHVKAACGTSRYHGADGLSYHGGYAAQQAWERFDFACMKNSAGENCNLVMGKLEEVSRKNQQAAETADQSLMCNECSLSGMKRRLEMPLSADLRADPAIASMVSSIASSCKTTLSITSPSPASPPWVMVEAEAATPTAAALSPSCADRMYTLWYGDTCQSVSQDQRISTAQLLAANGLMSKCRNFPSATGSQLCIPPDAVCEPYVVEAGDTCASIADFAKVGWQQIVAWNPELGRRCQNVGQYVGYVVCVSTPGGAWVQPQHAATGAAPEPLTLIDDLIPIHNGNTKISVDAISAEDEL